MRTLYLLRHSLTMANERRLYCGWTDLPLSEAGRGLAREIRVNRPLPDCGFLCTSGLKRADETLAMLTGRTPDLRLDDLREMNFGAFEMRGYEELKDDPDYRRWIEDCMGPGVMRCPDGESQREFQARVTRGGKSLLERPWRSAFTVTHGGVIVALMARWFPDEPRDFYQWQPRPCGGWRVRFDDNTPMGFEAIWEA